MWNNANYKKMREAYGDTLIELAHRDPAIIFVSADCGAHERAFFEREGRLIETGIAEQNSAGVAAGLAADGLKPHLLNFAYLLGRMYNHISQCICVDAYPVRIASYYAGVWGIGGKSHNCVTDISFMRALPNLTIFSPADYWETKTVVRYAETIPGPTYIRMAGVPTPTVFSAEPAFAPLRRLRDGDTVTIFCHGTSVSESVSACADGTIDAAIVNVTQLKPLPVEEIVREASQRPYVIVVEEHSRQGGAAEAIASVIAERCPRPTRIIAVPDVFPFSVLSEESDVYGRYGISARDIRQAAVNLVVEPRSPIAV